MSIKATCGGCGKTYAINEKYAGKRLPCKECGEKFHVPGGDDFDDFEDDFEPPPTRRRRPAGGSPGRGGPRKRSAPPARKRSKKKKRSSGPNWAVIGISAGAGVAAIALIVVLMMTVFSSSAESILRDMIGEMETLADTMETITDESSARAAGPKLARSLKRMVDLVKRAGSVDPSPEKEKELEKKYAERLANAERRLSRERVRIQRIPGAQSVMQDAMKEAGQKLMEAREEIRQRNSGRNRAPSWLRH